MSAERLKRRIYEQAVAREDVSGAGAWRYEVDIRSSAADSHKMILRRSGKRAARSRRRRVLREDGDHDEPKTRDPYEYIVSVHINKSP